MLVAALVFRETLMNVLCRENTHGHSQSQSNGDQRRVDALPRLIKQRVVIAPVRPQNANAVRITRRRPPCALRVSRHMLRYSAVEFAHTATGVVAAYPHAYGDTGLYRRANPHAGVQRARLATPRRLRGFAVSAWAVRASITHRGQYWHDNRKGFGTVT